MALSASALGSLMKSKVAAKQAAADPAKGTSLAEICDELAAAIVEHITSAAVVTTNVAPSQLGVVPGTVGGPVPVAPTPLTGTVT